MIDAPKLYTERQMCEAQRGAYVAGIGCSREDCAEHWAEAKRRYPLPRKTVPRVVTHYGMKFRVVSDRLECMTTIMDTGDWHDADRLKLGLTGDRVRVIADLFARPTEEVDADA